MSSQNTSVPVALLGPYAESSYDPLSARDLVVDEIRQRRETGYDVDEVATLANATDPNDRVALLALGDSLVHAERAPGWIYEEPNSLDDIRATLTTIPATTAVTPDHVADRIAAAWLGRIAGCNLGKPVEQGNHWTPAHIRDYLERAHAYPLSDYFPVLDPMPEGFELRDNWPETTRGNVNGSARDDDIDYSILALHLLEAHGSALRPEQVGTAWMTLFPLQQLYTAERAAYINLTNGLTVPDVAHFRNPYREWIGAQIRADVHGYVKPGNPWAAAALSYQDASLSHVGNGIYGEMWVAALVAAAFTAESAREAIDTALEVVPPKSRLAEAIRYVTGLYDDGRSWQDALALVHESYGFYAWVHTINNAAAIVAALLWSEGDWATATTRVVMSGWDTDSNGATVGSVAAILFGRDAIPDNFVAPLKNRTRSALFGFDNSSISSLAERTIRLALGDLA